MRDIPKAVLPSTSPAHASLDWQQKLERWQETLAHFLGIPANHSLKAGRNGKLSRFRFKQKDF
jgi:hypothetical protein